MTCMECLLPRAGLDALCLAPCRRLRAAPPTLGLRLSSGASSRRMLGRPSSLSLTLWWPAVATTASPASPCCCAPMPGCWARTTS